MLESSFHVHCVFLIHMQYSKSLLTLYCRYHAHPFISSCSEQRLSSLVLSLICSLGDASSKFLFSNRAHYFCRRINKETFLSTKAL